MQPKSVTEYPDGTRISVFLIYVYFKKPRISVFARCVVHGYLSGRITAEYV
jgi:hypothetical protein